MPSSSFSSSFSRPGRIGVPDHQRSSNATPKTPRQQHTFLSIRNHPYHRASPLSLPSLSPSLSPSSLSLSPSYQPPPSTGYHLLDPLPMYPVAPSVGSSSSYPLPSWSRPDRGRSITHHPVPSYAAMSSKTSRYQKRQFWSLVDKAHQADEVKMMRRSSKEEHRSRLSSLSRETQELLHALQNIDLTEVLPESDLSHDYQHRHHYHQASSPNQSSSTQHQPPLSELAPHSVLPVLAATTHQQPILSSPSSSSSSSSTPSSSGDWVPQEKHFLSSVAHPERAHTAIERVTEYVESLLSVRGERDAEAFAVMGDVFHRCQMYSLGITAYRRALEYTPSAALHLSLGDCYKHVGRLDLAARNMEAALKMNPDDGQAHYQRAMILQAMGKQKKALEAYQRAMTAGYHRPSLYMNYCVLAFQCGHDARAHDIGRRALAAWPEHGELYETLVSLYYVSGRIQDAVHLGEEAISRFPRSARQYHCLADIYARESMWEECRDCMERARSHGVSDRFILMHLSLAYAQLGHNREARDMFRLAKESAADGWEEDEYLAKLEKHLAKHHSNDTQHL